MTDKLLADIFKYKLILTGSMALKIYNMLPQREVNDIDLVFTSIETLRDFCANTGYSIKENVEKHSTRRYDENYFKLYYGVTALADCFIKPDVRIEVCGAYTLEYFRDIWTAKLKIILDRLPNNVRDDVYNKHLNDVYNFFPYKEALNKLDKPD